MGLISYFVESQKLICCFGPYVIKSFHSIFVSAVFSVAAIIPCCKADPNMSSNGDLSDLGTSDSFWEVQWKHTHTHTHTYV